MSAALLLIGFLIAEHQAVEDVWLHYEVKVSSFDTLGIYDLEHLFAAGVSATVAFVRESTHPLREDVLGMLAPQITDERLAEWMRRKRSRFVVED